MKYTAKERSIEAARAALKVHEETLGIEGDAEIQVWHLLVSVERLCMGAGIDFGEIVADARRHNRSEAAEEEEVPAKSAPAAKPAPRYIVGTWGIGEVGEARECVEGLRRDGHAAELVRAGETVFITLPVVPGKSLGWGRVGK